MTTDDEFEAWIASAGSGAGPGDADDLGFAVGVTRRLEKRRRRRAAVLWSFTAVGVVISATMIARLDWVIVQDAAWLAGVAASRPMAWILGLLLAAWLADTVVSPSRGDM